MSSTLAKRLKKLEEAREAEGQRGVDAAIAMLGRTMDPEHIETVQDWMSEHLPNGRIARPGESTYATLTRLKPPALVRAAWILVAQHLEDGVPISLAPDIARVYLEDPDAYPINACNGCGYLMPVRARPLPPDGVYRFLPGWYTGVCPVCARDNHPEEEALS